MKCPKCGLTNPDNALRCDCGFDFISKTMEKSFLINGNEQVYNKNAPGILNPSNFEKTGYYVLMMAAAVNVTIIGFFGGISLPSFSNYKHGNSEELQTFLFMSALILTPYIPLACLLGYCRKNQRAITKAFNGALLIAFYGTVVFASVTIQGEASLGSGLVVFFLLVIQWISILVLSIRCCIIVHRDSYRDKTYY